MKVSVNKAHFPVTVLGPGRRIGLWLQGCSIRCPNCISRDTWEQDPAKDIEIEQLLGWCKEISSSKLDGVTISGGEPFDQTDGLLELLTQLHAWRREQTLDFDILCYSGYPFLKLKNKYPEILALLDAVISEPFVDHLPMTKVWRGSSNQHLVPLSTLGLQRFESFVERTHRSSRETHPDGRTRPESLVYRYTGPRRYGPARTGLCVARHPIRPDFLATVMAVDFVRRCPSCDTENPADAMRCVCGAMLLGVDISPRTLSSQIVPPEPSHRAKPDQQACPYPDCGQPNASNASHCVYCARPLARSVSALDTTSPVASQGLQSSNARPGEDDVLLPVSLSERYLPPPESSDPWSRSRPDPCGIKRIRRASADQAVSHGTVCKCGGHRTVREDTGRPSPQLF